MARPPLPPITPEIVSMSLLPAVLTLALLLKLMGAEIVWLPVTLIVATPPPLLSVSVPVPLPWARV